MSNLLCPDCKQDHTRGKSLDVLKRKGFSAFGARNYADYLEWVYIWKVLDE